MGGGLVTPPLISGSSLMVKTPTLLVGDKGSNPIFPLKRLRLISTFFLHSIE